MPKARKTKSGKYRCRVVDHYEYVDGRRIVHFKSFTAASKAECERLAADYQATREEMKDCAVTVDEAIARYVTAKSNVLSPATLRAYRAYQRNAYAMIGGKRVQTLRSEDVQLWMNQYRIGHSPKTCRNAMGLLTASLSLQRPGLTLSVTMPQKAPPELYTPTDDDIKVLLHFIEGTELEKAVLLSAFGTLRRGEACAITYDDIRGDEIRINKSMTFVKGKGWAFKTTKNPSSIRTVKYPHFVIERLLKDRGKGNERVVKLMPVTVTDSFRKALKECNLPLFRFHDLRAYAISARHAIGIPDVYIMQDGGYKTDTVMKQVYRRAMSDKRLEFADITAEHFTSVFSKDASEP